MTRALAVLSLLLTGCLTRDAAEPRFYHPDAATLGSPDESARADTTGAPVRLRPVHEASFLRERMVWRASEVEYGRYEQRRWNELPAQYLARAMTNALQTNPALALTDDVTAPALALDLLAFDEIVTKPRLARVIVRATLRGPKGRTLLDRQFVVEEPIAAEGGSGVAHAMGKALDTVVAQVTSEVATRLTPATQPHRAGPTAPGTGTGSGAPGMPPPKEGGTDMQPGTLKPRSGTDTGTGPTGSGTGGGAAGNPPMPEAGAGTGGGPGR